VVAKTGLATALMLITVARTDRIVFLSHLPIAILLYHT
jgi:hypothetical protein